MATATEVREKPIIFSGQMVKAILDGRKTQTRRVIKPQPKYERPVFSEIGESWMSGTIGGEKFHNWWPYGVPASLHSCQYGVIGDRLWVRETWAQPYRRTETSNGCIYRADGPEYNSGACAKHQWGENADWRSPIHMPRWTSRITLEITDVRVQRLQEISSSDCIAEGLLPTNETPAKERFRELWDSINGKRGFDWDVNPWVWALTFRILEAT